MMPRQSEEENKWMLFDPAYTLVAQAELESKRGDCIAVLRPEGGKDKIKEAMQMRIVFFSWIEDPDLIYRGEVTSRRGGRLYLENVTRMTRDTGHHLRVRMEFKSKMLYYAEDRKIHAAPITSFDLSAGGIAFFSPVELEIGQECEVVIPVTAEMLVVRIKILRTEIVSAKKWKYAARFLELSNEEETMIRQAIFSEQWRRGKCRLLSGTYEGR